MQISRYEAEAGVTRRAILSELSGSISESLSDLYLDTAQDVERRAGEVLSKAWSDFERELYKDRTDRCGELLICCLSLTCHRQPASPCKLVSLLGLCR